MSRDLIAEARAVPRTPRSARGGSSPLAERSRMIHLLADEVEALRGQLAEIRTLATEWANQPNPHHIDTRFRQIEDGRALLALIDGHTLPEEP
ncbi:hypothetical protein [Nocardia sp. MW-W600-9]